MFAFAGKMSVFVLILYPLVNTRAAPVGRVRVRVPRSAGPDQRLQSRPKTSRALSRQPSNEGFDQRVVKSNGAEPKSSLITWLGLNPLHY